MCPLTQRTSGSPLPPPLPHLLSISLLCILDCDSDVREGVPPSEQAAKTSKLKLSLEFGENGGIISTPNTFLGLLGSSLHAEGVSVCRPAAVCWCCWCSSSKTVYTPLCLPTTSNHVGLGITYFRTILIPLLDLLNLFLLTGGVSAQVSGWTAAL